MTVAAITRPEDLVARPYAPRAAIESGEAPEGSVDCYVCVREGLASLGVALPERPVDLMGWVMAGEGSTLFDYVGSSKRCTRGDVLVLRREGLQHMALALDAFRAVDAVGGSMGRPGKVRITRIDLFRRSNSVESVWRPRALHAPRSRL